MSARLQATQEAALNISNTTLPTENISCATNKGKGRAVDDNMDVGSESELTSLDESPGSESEEETFRPVDKGKQREVNNDMLAPEEEDSSPETDEEPVRWNGLTEDGEDDAILA